MLSYDNALTSQTLEANARHLDKPQAVLLEDIGTYFAFHPNVEALRRLLRFGGADFIEFLNLLDDLPDRARLAADDLELPELFLVQLTEGVFRLVCRAKLPVGGMLWWAFYG